MQKTANQIKSEFETLASGHYQIHSFLYAQEFEQQAYENLIYPLMLVYPLGGSLSGTTYSRNYRVIIADRVLKSEGNELEVESDTQLIALDVLAYWMKLGQNERFTITSSNTITPFWEKWGDEVTGHFVDIGIEEFYDFNSCAIPLSGSIPTPINPCKDARISVNSVVYGNAPSDTNFNVVVKDQDGDLVGSLIGGEWIVNTGGSCADATYTIEDTLGNVLYTGSIVSGGSLTQAIGNSTLNINDSAGTLISSETILAEGTDSYNVADSVAVIKDSAGTTLKSENILATASENITINDSVAVIKDSANNTLKSENIPAEASENITINNSTVNIRDTAANLLHSVSVRAEATTTQDIADTTVGNSDVSYSVNVLAEGSLTLPDQQINVNSVDEGDIPSVGTIDIDLSDGVNPVIPTSVTITGRTIDIVVPEGSTPMNVDFSADKFTAYIAEDITFTDLSNQSPTHWSWRFSDGTTSIVQNPVKNFLTLGQKNVTLLAAKSNAGGVITKNSYIEIIGDIDAGAFLNATGITDPTIIAAINVLVIDLKNASLWTKLNAIYPMVGGSATTHKFNLKNPLDTNAAFRLSFNGGWTHDANGATPNGTNAYADTFLNISLQTNWISDNHMSFYSRTTTPSGSGWNMGVGNESTGAPLFGLSAIRSSNVALYDSGNFPAERVQSTQTDCRGLWLGSTAASNSRKIYRNNNLLATNTTTGTTPASNAAITLGALRNTSSSSFFYMPQNMAYSSIGTSLSDAEVATYYNIIQSFQTTLGRQV